MITEIFLTNIRGLKYSAGIFHFIISKSKYSSEIFNVQIFKPNIRTKYSKYFLEYINVISEVFITQIFGSNIQISKYSTYIFCGNIPNFINHSRSNSEAKVPLQIFGMNIQAAKYLDNTVHLLGVPFSSTLMTLSWA